MKTRRNLRNCSRVVSGQETPQKAGSYPAVYILSLQRLYTEKAHSACMLKKPMSYDRSLGAASD